MRFYSVSANMQIVTLFFNRSSQPSVIRLVNMVADVCPEIIALVHMATWDRDVKLVSRLFKIDFKI